VEATIFEKLKYFINDDEVLIKTCDLVKKKIKFLSLKESEKMLKFASFLFLIILCHQIRAEIFHAQAGK
jgi:hypothetical protein